MADLVFTVALGRGAELAALTPANSALIAVLLQDTGLESDALLAEHPDLANLLLANTEATATGYARQTLTTVTVANSAGEQHVHADTIDFGTLGGATDNLIAKLVVCYDPDTTGGTDADLIPISAFDVLTDTTDPASYFDTGTALVALTFTMSSTGLYRATYP